MLPGIGVFGTGTAVRCLVPILKSCGFRVEAIWGQTKEIAAVVAKDLDIEFSTSKIGEVLLRKEVDLVFINCPPQIQAEIAQKAMGIGKHVICGTPIGANQVDALKMESKAQYYPKNLSLMCNGLRFLPCFVKMKQLIEDGYIGEVSIVEARVHCGSLLKDQYGWRCDELMGGGILNTHGSIFIDLINFLINQKAVEVSGMLKTYTIQTEKINGIRQITSDDYCSFQMELDRGACATVTLNTHLTGQYMHEVLVCGTKGRLVVRASDLFGQKEDMVKEELLHKDIMNILDEQKSGVTEAIRAEIPVPHMKGLIKLIDSVKDAFKSEEDRHSWTKEPISSAANFEEAQYMQTVVDAVKLSSKTKKWVKVKILMEEPDTRRSTYSLS